MPNLGWPIAKSAQNLGEKYKKVENVMYLHVYNQFSASNHQNIRGLRKKNSGKLKIKG